MLIMLQFKNTYKLLDTTYCWYVFFILPTLGDYVLLLSYARLVDVTVMLRMLNTEKSAALHCINDD
jgi:hypothetical protein